MIKRYCDACMKEIVYSHVTLRVRALPNANDSINTSKEFCYTCGRRIKNILSMTLRVIDPDRTLTIKDLENIIDEHK